MDGEPSSVDICSFLFSPSTHGFVYALYELVVIEVADLEIRTVSS